jgi:hypothetical protein
MENDQLLPYDNALNRAKAPQRDLLILPLTPCRSNFRNKNTISSTRRGTQVGAILVNEFRLYIIFCDSKIHGLI